MKLEKVSRNGLIQTGWVFIGANEDGLELWEQANDELYYNNKTGMIIGVFSKDLITEIYEKAKAKEKKVH